MDRLSIPDQVVYAGLAGTLLALIVAAISNGYSLRVLFLLALRLAIGWHFLFEGLHKIHSTYLGPTETNKPFTSEPYFKVAPTFFGKLMRSQFADHEAIIAEKLTRPKPMSPAEFDKLTGEEQAVLCPPVVAKQFDSIKEAIQAYARYEIEEANRAESSQLKSANSDEEKAKIKSRTEDIRQTAQKRVDDFKEPDPAFVTAAKATYARWVYGVDSRDAKVKFLTGDAPLSALDRREHIAWLKEQLELVDRRQSLRLGNGTYEVKRASELRGDLQSEEASLADDAEQFIGELLSDLNGGRPVPAVPVTKRGVQMDQLTMWFITAIGISLLAGLFTRMGCLLGAGFLVMTYLTHPAVPWYPQPPNTEGNPLFVNKNVIEALALLSLATFPTGRWLGLDALIGLFCCRKKPTNP